jgi:hypothetical protein
MGMEDRETLVARIARAVEGQDQLDPTSPQTESREVAERALAQVELFLGVQISEAKEAVSRILQTMDAG